MIHDDGIFGMNFKTKKFNFDSSVVFTALAGSLFIGLMLFHNITWRNATHNYLPLLDDISVVKLHLSMGHLALEEALQNEDIATREESQRHFSDAVEGLKEVFAGRSVLAGMKTDLPPDSQPKSRFSKLYIFVKEVKRLGDDRWNNRLDKGVNDEIARNFHITYKKAIDAAQISEAILQTIVSREIVLQGKTELTNIFAAFFLLVLGVSYLYIQAKKRNKIDHELKSKEKRFSDIAQSAGDWIWETDKKGYYTFANPVVRQIMGYAPEELVGRHMLDFFSYSGAALVADATREFFAMEKPFRSYPTVQSHKNGELVSLESAGVPRLDDEGRFLGYRGVTRNVTDRVRSEEKIRRSLSLLDSINNAQASIIADQKPGEVFDSLLDDILALTKSAFGFIGETLTDENDAVYVKVMAITNVAWNDESQKLYDKISKGGLEFRNLDNLMGSVAKSGKPVIANDAPNDSRRGGIPSGHPEIKRYMGLPIYKGSKLVGVVGMANRRSGYDEELARFLEPFLSTCANIIEAIRSEKKRKQVEGELALISKIFETANEGVMITDVDTNIIMVNPAVTDITGYESSELIGKTPRILKSDRNDDSFYNDMWRAIGSGGKWQGEIWNRRKNGEAYLEWLSITSISNERGVVVKYISTFHDISELRRSKEQLAYSATHDSLTKLPNRRLFEDRLSQAIASTHRKNSNLGVLLLSLDRFKKVNESLGHAAGDVLLQLISERLSETIKEGDTLARWGGDEFVFIIEEVGQPQDIVNIAARMVDTIAAPFMVGDQELYLTASVGATLYPLSASDIKTLMQTADLAMKRAKEHGGANFQLYTPAMDSQAYEALSLERDLRKALARNEIVAYYQPKVDVKSGMVVGMEALARWNHASLGQISPVKFIPLAEETGLIVFIGERILFDACSQLKKWLDLGYGPLTVSVNLSALQFSQSNLTERVRAILEETGLPPQNLDLEITEGTVMHNVENAIETMEELSAMGSTISIDDFGTGYSSLSYLKRFPLNTLKIDRSFINDVTVNSDDAAIADTIISMAHSLKLKVVAEGVETFEQFRFLKDKGCDEIQGFLFSPPVDIERFEEILADKKLLVL